MAMGEPKDLRDIRRFFLEPGSPKHRQYEALRAYFVEGTPSAEVARAFGYSESAFHVLCHHFRRDPDPVFFVVPRKGPQAQPKKSAARDLIVQLRKQNHSVYEISEALKEQKHPLSPTAVREVLKSEGFSALPRRMDDERPERLGPSVEAVADVREFALTPRQFQALRRMRNRQIEHAELLAGIVASTTANYSMGAPEKPRQAREFMPSQWAPERPRKLTRKQVALKIIRLFQ